MFSGQASAQKSPAEAGEAKDSNSLVQVQLQPASVRRCKAACAIIARGLATHHLAGMTLDLTDEEGGASTHLRQATDYDPYPFTPRLDPLKAISAKLDPPAPRPIPLPPLKLGMAPSHGQKRRGR